MKSLVTAISAAALVVCATSGEASVVKTFVGAPNIDANAAGGFASAPLSPRKFASAVAVGQDIIIWGGETRPHAQQSIDGAKYNTASQRWTSLSAFPFNSASDYSSAVVGNRMYVFDSSSGTDAFYDVSSDQWTVLPNSPLFSRLLAPAIAVGTKIIVWGGSATRSGALASDGAIFDTARNSWTEMLAPSPLAGRVDFAAVAVGHKLVIWGGHGSSGGPYPTWEPLSDGAIYDADSNSWSQIASSPLSARYRPAFAKCGNEIVIFGGSSEANHGFGYMDGAVYDLSTDQWKMLPQSPLSSRSSVNMACVGRKLILFGGYDESNLPSVPLDNDGAIYDFDSDTWQLLPQIPWKDGRRGVAATVVGSLVFLWGGQSNVSTQPDGEGLYYNDGLAFDVDANAWTSP